MHRRALLFSRNENVARFSEIESYYDQLLQSCGNLITLEQIHSSLITRGIIRQSPHLGAKLIIKYSKYELADVARSLFDEIRHGSNSFLWNTMLRAYANGDHSAGTLELYLFMRRTGIQPNNYTFPFVFKACAFESLSVQGKSVHGEVIRSGFDSDMYVESALVDMYAKCGLIDDACQVFDKMSVRDLAGWTAMVTAYEQAGRAKNALVLFKKMQGEGLAMDSIAAVSVASAIGQLRDIKIAESAHSYAICNALVDDICVKNAIIAMYAKCGNVEMARLVFDLMEEKDSISWNSILSAYTQNGLASEALLLFDQMQASGAKFHPVTALIMVSACAYLGSRQHGRRLHNLIITSEIEIDVTLRNAIMDMYAKCGDLDTAIKMFNNSLPGERDASSWNVLISAYGIHGFGKEALELFSQMLKEGVQPNHITFTSILSACSHAGLIDEGRICFENMTKFSVTPEAKHYACMVDMLGRAGLLHEAYNLIKQMPLQPNDAVWGALLLACRIHKNTKLGEIAANNLFQIEPQHSGYYVLMSNLYAASGKWQEVGHLRQDMKIRGVKKPAAFSVIEFGNEVHGFQTADQINPYWREVYREVDKLAVEMKMKGYVPDRSCVLHDVEEEDKELALNYHSEKLALAFGLMKIGPGSPIHVTKNLRVCNDCHSAFKFVSYIYGRKIVVRDANRFHHFQGGLCSCKDYW
ncbi:hypothetical protein NMG60_11016360 [Bertholletia excelsa]